MTFPIYKWTTSFVNNVIMTSFSTDGTPYMLARLYLYIQHPLLQSSVYISNYNITSLIYKLTTGEEYSPSTTNPFKVSQGSFQDVSADVVVRRWSMRRWVGKISMVEVDLNWFQVVTVQLVLLQEQRDHFLVVSDMKCNGIKSSQTVNIIIGGKPERAHNTQGAGSGIMCLYIYIYMLVRDYFSE